VASRSSWAGLAGGISFYAKLTGVQPILCPGDVCQTRVKEPIQHVAPGQALIAAVAVVVVGGLTTQAALEPLPVATPATPVSADAGAWAPILEDVEGIRVALANDQVAGVAQRAERIALAVEALPASVDGAPTPTAAAIGRAARALHALGDDAPVDAVRSAFGDLMRALVEHLIAEPRLQEGYYLFECPMTTTYRRWVQRSPSMANPYMGSRMLRCGTAVSTWSVEG
jgi:membrane fusion protein, copper/silver efflux system